MIFLLLDKDNKMNPSAMITTETTTAQELQDIIYEMEKTIDDYCSDDLEDVLPADCKICWIYGDEEIIW